MFKNDNYKALIIEKDLLIESITKELDDAKNRIKCYKIRKENIKVQMKLL
jgi:hypothetical protein